MANKVKESRSRTRSIYLEDWVFDAFTAISKANNRTVSESLNSYMKAVVKRHKVSAEVLEGDETQ
jgi:hypothetical protein